MEKDISRSPFNFKDRPSIRAAGGAIPALGVALLLFGAACRTSPSPGCPHGDKEVPVDYMGGAIGSGTLMLRSVRGDGEHVAAAMVLFGDPEGTKVLMSLSGPGSCRHGLLRARFGAGDATESEVRVLGGFLEAVLQPELYDAEIFGVWQAELVVKESGERRTIEGFVRSRRDLPPAQQVRRAHHPR